MHSLAECPLRTCCRITTTNQYPFHILHLNNSALDLFLTNNPSIDEDSTDCLSPNSLSELRKRTLECLRGKPITDIISPDQDSCPAPSTVTTPKIHGGDTLQPFVIVQSALIEDLDNDSNPKNSNTKSRCLKSYRSTRRLHGCIHSSTPYFLSSHLQQTPMSVAQSHSQQELQQDQISSSSSQDQDALCCVYVLKDVTEIHSMALATKSDLSYRQRRQRFPQSPQLSRSTIPTPSFVLSYSNKTHPRSVTRQKPYTTDSNSDLTPLHQTIPRSLSSCSSASCSPLYSQISSVTSSTASSTAPSPSISPSPTPNILLNERKDLKFTHHSEDLGLLLLHVTRFGTIDHAYVISQQQQTEKSSTSGFFALDGTAIQEMTSMPVMSYTHPDDIRTLCRVLGQICKSYDTTFRVRWRLQSRSQHDESDESDESEIMNPNDPTLPIQEGYSRMIEYKGESFEEWVDLTAVFNPTSSLKTQDQDHRAESPKEQFESGKYIWVEIKGKQSNGQPLLVVRPLTPQETQEHRANTSMLAKLVPNALDQRQGMEREHDQSNKEMRIRTKRMGLKEGKNLPNWLNVSALTDLAMTPRQDELGVRMPGSFPADMTVSSMKGHTQQSTQLSLPTSACYSRSAGGIINVPSIAYQANAIPPWDLFVNNALDAWKQWILTVHAGQAQFHDWCEYLLETTIDHLIESVSLGLKLLDLEKGSGHLQLEEGHEQVATKTTAQSNDCHEIQSLPEACERSTDARRQQQQKLSGGIRRVGKILHSYPSIEGVVLTFGNSWLGRKIKSRLEHKLLDSAADQVLEWWYSGEGVDETSLDTPSKPIDSTNVDSLKSIAVTETL